MESTASLGCNVFGIFWKDQRDDECWACNEFVYLYFLLNRFVWIDRHTMSKYSQNGAHSLARV